MDSLSLTFYTFIFSGVVLAFVLGAYNKRWERKHPANLPKDEKR